MKFKEWLSYKKTITRKDIIEILLWCLIPGIAPCAIVYALICKPHNKKGEWKK